MTYLKIIIFFSFFNKKQTFHCEQIIKCKGSMRNTSLIGRYNALTKSKKNAIIIKSIPNKVENPSQRRSNVLVPSLLMNLSLDWLNRESNKRSTPTLKQYQRFEKATI